MGTCITHLKINKSPYEHIRKMLVICLFLLNLTMTKSCYLSVLNTVDIIKLHLVQYLNYNAYTIKWFNMTKH